MSKQCRCPMCSGNGYIYITDGKGRTRQTCGACQGSGKVCNEQASQSNQAGGGRWRRQKKPGDSHD